MLFQSVCNLKIRDVPIKKASDTQSPKNMGTLGQFKTVTKKVVKFCGEQQHRTTRR